jgi:archaetidylinositol phosphate synthase
MDCRMPDTPFDQRLARTLVRSLARFPITPNQMTTITLIVALTGAVLIAAGDVLLVNWGAGLFVIARFMDHFDGELARMKQSTSKFGYYYDYVTGALSYAALFLCMGIGHRYGLLDNWAIALGAAGASAALISMVLNLGIDKVQDFAEGESIGYPALYGFELEDGIYLIAPITWLGWLEPFFIAAGIGAAIYTLWTLATLRRLKRRAAAELQ